MRQVRITSQNIDIPTDQDCFISPDDPLNDIKKQQMLGGLNPASKEFKDDCTILDIDRAKELIKYYYDQNNGGNMAMPFSNHAA